MYKIIKSREEWNEKISKQINFSPYQCFEWGEYKKKSGWIVLSLMGNKDGAIGYLQFTCKKKFNIVFAWCIGSIAGDLSPFNRKDLEHFFSNFFSVKKVLIRSSFTIPRSTHEAFDLFCLGWKTSQIKKINTDFTIYLDLQQPIQNLLNSCSANFRKNIKRGLEQNNVELLQLSQCDISKIFELYVRFSKIKSVLDINKEEFENIQSALGERIIVAITKNNKDIIALRAFLFLKNKALDFWAFSDECGRKTYASYALIFRLLEQARHMEITSYDLSGIDPIKNPQVFSFKNGLRGEIVEKLGEWEISNSKLYSLMFNNLILGKNK